MSADKTWFDQQTEIDNILIKQLAILQETRDGILSLQASLGSFTNTVNENSQVQASVAQMYVQQPQTNIGEEVVIPDKILIDIRDGARYKIERPYVISRYISQIGNYNNPVVMTGNVPSQFVDEMNPVTDSFAILGFGIMGVTANSHENRFMLFRNQFTNSQGIGFPFNILTGTWDPTNLTTAGMGATQGASVYIDLIQNGSFLIFDNMKNDIFRLWGINTNAGAQDSIITIAAAKIKRIS